MIEVNLPNAHVEGEIASPDDDPFLLRDGMLYVEVAGYSIDVSWYPEHDPSGQYVITVYRESWEEQLISAPESDPYKVRELVENLAVMLSMPIVALSGSTQYENELVTA